MLDLIILLINLFSSILMLFLGLACLLAPVGTVIWMATLAQSFLPVQLFIREDRRIPWVLLRLAGLLAILVAIWVAYSALSGLVTMFIG